MAAASPWTHDQIAETFRRSPELKHLLLDDVEDTGQTLGDGKMIHESLIEHCNKGTEDVVVNFFLECKLMSELRHPHIVQFLGVCMLPTSKTPVLLMELLSDCLHNILEKRQNLSLEVKLSILYNVSSALVFLHSRTPQIIHRDLTAKNVLIDQSGMKAKLSDLGNSRFLPRPNVSMTRAPGTLQYMPPEALEKDATYCEKLDMFSFGHLSLYTITQVFPDLLGPNTQDKAKRLKPRSEIERRKPYLDILHAALHMGKEHVIARIIEQCLSNDPQERPTAMDALQLLEDLTLGCDYEDMNAGRMVDILHKKDEHIVQLQRQQTQMQKKITEMNMVDVKIGPLKILRPKRITIGNKTKVWKSYSFKIVNNTHLKYYKTWLNIVRGELALSSVIDVVIAPQVRGENYCFEIHFIGNNSPWTVAAYSVAERKSWMEVIRSNQDPRMKRNVVYGFAPLKAGRNEKAAEEEDEPYYEVVQEPAFQPKPQPKQPSLPYRPPHLGKANAATGNNKTKREKGAHEKRLKPPSDRAAATKTDSNRPDYDKMFASLNRKATNFTDSQLEHLITMLQKAKVKSVDDDDDYGTKGSEKDSHSAQAQSPYYMEVLGERKCGPSEEVQSPCETFPRTATKSPFYINITDVCERGRQVSRGEVSDHTRRPRSVSPISRNRHYVNFSRVMESFELKPPPVPKRSHSHLHLNDLTAGASERGGIVSKHPHLPTRVSKSTSPSPYHLSVPNAHENQRQTLKRVLKESSSPHKQTSETLLVPEDDSPMEHASIIRPQWARANTSNPGRKTLAAMHRKSFQIKHKSLTKITDLGEGRFGMVYKAEMKSRHSSVTVAVKPVAQITSDVWKELSQVVHPNIVSLHGLISEGDLPPSIVMEYLPNGDLKSFLASNMRIREQLLKYMIDVAMGMHYLSEQGIIHRNLAARNVLVDEKEMCKVADFGLVHDAQQELHASPSRGTSPVRWMAPESMSKGVFSTASDIWSYGILQWEMFNPHKLYPYPTLQNDEVVEKVIQGYPLPVPRHTPQMIVRIMKACWKIDPSLRPSFLLISKLLTEQMIGRD